MAPGEEEECERGRQREVQGTKWKLVALGLRPQKREPTSGTSEEEHLWNSFTHLAQIECVSILPPEFWRQKRTLASGSPVRANQQLAALFQASPSLVSCRQLVCASWQKENQDVAVCFSRRTLAQANTCLA